MTPEQDLALRVELAKLMGWTVKQDNKYVSIPQYHLLDPSGASVSLHRRYSSKERAWEMESPAYTSSLDAQVPVWQEIERRGLVTRYLHKCALLMGHDQFAALQPPLDGSAAFIWCVLTLTPEQHTRAAIAVLKEAK